MTDMPRQTSSGQELLVQGVTVRPRATLFYGWWVVLACAVGLFWGPPVTVFSFPVFLKPLMQDFHAGRAAVSFGFTLHLIAVAIGAPLVGWLIDRYGSRKVILLATSIFGFILLLNKLFSANLWQFYFFYIVLGLVGNGVGPLPYGKVVSLWFDRYRGLALGLMMVGIGSGAMIMPSFAQQLIARYGWHTAYTVLGAAVLLIAIPVVPLFSGRSRRIWAFCPTACHRKMFRPGAKPLCQVSAHWKRGALEHFGSWCALSS